jgi:hypothetical protein
MICSAAPTGRKTARVVGIGAASLLLRADEVIE